MARALITGITGQDGSYLSEFLLGKGYEVYGLVRRSSNDPFVRLPPEVKKHVSFVYGNLPDSSSLERAMNEVRPDEIYNLAAQSDVGLSFKIPEETMEVNYHGVGRLVDAVRKIKPDVRVYQASSSDMFGKAKSPQNEQSLFQPVSPYGEAKLKAHEDFIVGYREKYGLFASSGILFNHESPRRGEHFVTRKTTISLAKIKLGLQDSFELGNLDARRDWGFAGDYVEAMWLMLQQEKPDDFVIATGITHTVREFVVAAGAALGIHISFEGAGPQETGKDQDGRVILRVNPKFYRPTEVDVLFGDSSKAARMLKWHPKTSFAELAAMMAQSDLKLFKSSM